MCYWGASTRNLLVKTPVRSILLFLGPRVIGDLEPGVDNK
jgi:hypothetical protein